jgi:hypothetical protein
VSCELWAVGCGLWAVGCGLWAVGCGLWAVSCELCEVCEVCELCELCELCEPHTVGPPVILRLSRLGNIHVSCFKCFEERAPEHTAVGAMRVSADSDAVAKQLQHETPCPRSRRGSRRIS